MADYAAAHTQLAELKDCEKFFWVPIKVSRVTLLPKDCAGKNSASGH